MAAFCAAASTYAQDALSSSIVGEKVARERRQRLEQEPANIQWGDLKLLLEASSSLEWNDNVNLSSTQAQQDGILRPLLHVDAARPITDLNAVRLSLGVGYDKYFSHSAYDRVVVTPDSSVAWDFFVKDVRVNLHDSFSYQEDPSIYGSLSGVARFGGFNNSAGANATWDLQDVILLLGYDHANFLSSTAQFSYLDRSSDYVTARSMFRLHPSLDLGLEAGGGRTDYSKNLLGDTLSYNVGITAEWKLAPTLHLSPRTGYFGYRFDPSLISPSSGTFSGYYYGIELNHILNERFNYTLETGREVVPGTYSQFVDRWSTDLRLSWRFRERWSLWSGLSYETASQPIGNATQDYDRWSSNLGLGVRLSESLRMRFDYRLFLKTSETAGLDYTQNRVTAQVTYRF